MRKLVVAGLLSFSAPLMALDLGLKLGGADVVWKDGDTTPLDLYAAVYAESLSPISPAIRSEPSVTNTAQVFRHSGERRRPSVFWAWDWSTRGSGSAPIRWMGSPPTPSIFS